MLKNLILYLYPGINKDELKKFEILSIIFFLIIGAYWSLRLLKNAIFMKVAFPMELGWEFDKGRHLQPLAKILSVPFVLIMVTIYSGLISKYKKHQLFYIICSFYSVLFMLIAGVLFIKDSYGLEGLGRILGGWFNDNHMLASKYILAATGWASYFFVESFGSLVVALFWSFTSSITTTESAKNAYPFIVSVAQIAAIIGSIPLFFTEKIGSFWPILLLTSLLVTLVIPAVYYFMKVIPPDQMVGDKVAAKAENQKEMPQILQQKGIKLNRLWQIYIYSMELINKLFGGIIFLVTSTYLIGVFIISTFYETIAQIIEYQMQSQATGHPFYGTEHGFGQFQSIYGMSINTLSFLISFLGTSKLIKYFGVRQALLVYPIASLIVLAFIFSLYFMGIQGTNLLWIMFGIMVIVKGLGYAVSNPTKEIMYIPTSKDVKFKAKGFIDTFGSRIAKLGGGLVNDRFKKNLSELMLYGTSISVILNLIWVAAAAYVGYRNQKLVKENKIID